MTRPTPLRRLAPTLRLLPLLAGAAAPALAAAQQPVAGTVRDADGAAVPGARVALPARERLATTTRDGRFTLGTVPAGRATVVVSAIGFAPARQVVDVGTGADTLRLLLVLRRSAVDLAAVQVTASPVARDPGAVAQPTASLDGRALDRALGTSLGATLAAIPGVAERSFGPAASAPIVRGLSGDRVAVLHDGQRAGDLASTAPDHAVTIDPGTARRVEIVRGPAALLHGSNALGGVVNVVSEDIPLERPGAPRGTLASNASSASPGAGLSLGAALPLGGRGVVQGRVGLRRHADMHPGGGLASLVNTDQRALNGSLGYALLGERASAGVAVRGHDFEYGLPSPDPSAGLVRLRGRREELLGRVVLPGAGVVTSVRVDGTAQRYHHDEANPAGVVATRLALASAQLQAVARVAGGERFGDGALGLSLQRRTADVTGATALVPVNDGEAAGVFVFQDLPLLRRADPARTVRLPVGVRWERHALASRGSAHFGPPRSRRFHGLSASAGLVVPLGEGVTVAANLARAYRPPTAEELWSLASHAGTGAFERGDPSLEAEVGIGRDLSLRIARRSVSAELSAYVNDVRGFIALRPTGRDTAVAYGGGTTVLPLVMAQQRDATLRGGELLVEVAPDALHGAVLGVMGDVVRASEADGSPLPWIPPARLGLSARREGRSWSAGVEGRRALAHRRVVEGEPATAGYTLVNLHAGVRFPLGGRMHLLTARLDNATDALWYDAASRTKGFAPGMGRNASLVYRAMF